jgi:hypothetical protein
VKLFFGFSSTNGSRGEAEATMALCLAKQLCMIGKKQKHHITLLFLL